MADLLWLSRLSPSTHQHTGAGRTESVSFTPARASGSELSFTTAAGTLAGTAGTAAWSRSVALRMPRWSKRCLNFAGSLRRKALFDAYRRMLVYAWQCFPACAPHLGR